MPFQNRTSGEILRELSARVVARSTLTDVQEGSVIETILASVAEEVANEEQRLKQIRDSFSFLRVSGADLDDRVADLPVAGLARLGATAASGGALTLTRDSTTGALTIPAGSLYGRSDDPSLVYRQIADQTFGVGVATITGVAVQCAAPGLLGNCAAALITRVVSAPSDLGAVVNTIPLVNGQDAESDAQLKARALNYLAALTKTTPRALEFEALSFVASDGTRARFARIFEDPSTPGLAQLLLDDGGGLVGYTRAGLSVSGVVPSGGPPILWHEAPAVDTPTRIFYSRSGIDTMLNSSQYTSIPERGLVYVNAGILQAGDTWTVEKYDVFEGLPGELQTLIEGSPSDPLNLPGLRAAGVRVRVTRPSVYYVEMKINVVPVSGADFADVSEQTKNAALEYLATLGPGETLYSARLIDRIMDNPDVLTVRLYVGGVAGLEPLPDYAPPSPRYVIRSSDDRISIVALPEVI